MTAKRTEAATAAKKAKRDATMQAFAEKNEELTILRKRDAAQIESLQAQVKDRTAERDVARAECNDLRDKLMSATLQVERMQGYFDAIADHEPLPDPVPQAPQFQDRMLRRDGFGGLTHGVSLNETGRRPSYADSAVHAFTGERPWRNWWHR